MFSSLSNSFSSMIHRSLVCHVWAGREADVIPIRPLFPWTCIFIHHFCHMLSTHSHLDQTQGPIASVNSKEMGRLLYKTAQTTATLKSSNNDEQSQQLFIIPKPGINELISYHQDEPEFFISFTNFMLLGKIPLSQYIRLSPLCRQGVAK